jgi:hypothetical protein
MSETTCRAKNPPKKASSEHIPTQVWRKNRLTSFRLHCGGGMRLICRLNAHFGDAYWYHNRERTPPPPGEKFFSTA